MGEQCNQELSGSEPSDDGFGIPAWLDRSVSPEMRQSAWEIHRQLPGTPRPLKPDLAQAGASLEEKISAPATRDLYAENKLLKQQKRIAKLKASLERKNANTKAMPLTGKAALRAIKEGVVE